MILPFALVARLSADVALCGESPTDSVQKDPYRPLVTSLPFTPSPPHFPKRWRSFLLPPLLLLLTIPPLPMRFPFAFFVCALQNAANSYHGRQIKWASIVKDVPELVGA